MNTDNLISEDNIINLVIELMEKAEQFIEKTGIEKKVMVLNNLKNLVGFETYERYKYLVGSIIDFIIQVSKGKKININNIKKKFCCFNVKKK